MIEIVETVEGRLSAAEAFDFLLNFDNIQAWDPTVLIARALTPGPVGLGSRFRLCMQFGLRPVVMDYTLVDMQPPGRLVLEGRGASFRARDHISIQAQGRGFRLVYTLHIAFDRHGRRLEALRRIIGANNASRRRPCRSKAMCRV